MGNLAVGARREPFPLSDHGKTRRRRHGYRLQVGVTANCAWNELEAVYTSDLLPGDVPAAVEFGRVAAARGAISLFARTGAPNRICAGSRLTADLHDRQERTQRDRARRRLFRARPVDDVREPPETRTHRGRRRSVGMGNLAVGARREPFPLSDHGKTRRRRHGYRLQVGVTANCAWNELEAVYTSDLLP